MGVKIHSTLLIKRQPSKFLRLSIFKSGLGFRGPLERYLFLNNHALWYLGSICALWVVWWACINGFSFCLFIYTKLFQFEEFCFKDFNMLIIPGLCSTSWARWETSSYAVFQALTSDFMKDTIHFVRFHEIQNRLACLLCSSLSRLWCSL